MLQKNLVKKSKLVIPPKFVYPFFLIHMLGFGGSGFEMAYGWENPDVLFLYMHGGIAIFVYIKFYLAIFGKEEVKWMFINAGLGILGIYSQIGWILGWFGKEISDYPIYLHIIPVVYFVLYTFLLHQAVLDLTGARSNPVRKRWVDIAYVVGSVGSYLATIVFGS